MALGKWTTAALAASLALNVFVVGAVVGGRAAGVRLAGPHTEAPAPQGEVAPWLGRMNPEGLVRRLPREERRRIARMIGAQVREARPLLLRARQARAEAYRALRAEPFDADAAAAAIAASREADDAVRARGQDVIIAILAELSPEARAQVFKPGAGERLRPGQNRLRQRRAVGEDETPPGTTPETGDDQP